MPVELPETTVELWDSRLAPVLRDKKDELENVEGSPLVNTSDVDRI